MSSFFSTRGILKLAGVLAVISAGCIGAMLVLDIGTPTELKETLTKTLGIIALFAVTAIALSAVLGGKK